MEIKFLLHFQCSRPQFHCARDPEQSNRIAIMEIWKKIILRAAIKVFSDTVQVHGQF